MTLPLLMVLIVAGAYGALVVVRLGLHQRLPLALGRISLDTIPDRAARRYGDRILFTTDQPCGWQVPALQDDYPDAHAWSALRIRRTAGHVAAYLREGCNVADSERIAVMKENHLDIHVLVTAVVRTGAIACPINDRFDSGEVQGYLRRIGARIMISDSRTVSRILGEGGRLGGIDTLILAGARGAEEESNAGLERRLVQSHPTVAVHWLQDALADIGIEAEPVRRGAEETLLLVHSSGTTGSPKPVTLRNGAQSHAIRGWLCYVHLSRSRDRGYLAVPNNHQAVILTFHALLLLGLPVHWARCCHRHGFDPEGLVRELAEGGYTGFFAFPIVYTRLKEVPLERYDLRRMRFWASTADASHEVIMRRFVAVGGAFRSFGLPFDGSVYLDAQGSSEVGTPSVLRYVTRFTRRFDRRIGRPGSTPFGPRIRIMKPDGQRAGRGEAGRLEVKGRTVFAGYWNEPALTALAFRDDWFFTGDIARRGRDGHLVQLDREVDVIHTRTGPLYTLPIEEKLHRHPAVYDVCVYGAHQPDGTQSPAAAVALRPPGGTDTPDTLEPELNALLRPEERLHRLDVLPWEAFPVGVTGKTLKRVFRDRTVPDGWRMEQDGRSSGTDLVDVRDGPLADGPGGSEGREDAGRS